MLTVSEIAHVAIMVSDVERTLDFYVNKLGFEEVMRLDRDGALWLVYLRVTDTQFIEIFHGGTGDRAPAFELIGYNHLCLSVPDIEKSVVELEQAGIPLYRAKKLGLDGNWQCWIEDPDGHRIEVMQMMPDGMQMTAIARRR
ncbi:VOC family protein [Agrobacterium larrymoorei]|uniref:VOC family protein n=1 Tax=Agrobacterium larrymoorei TaxID=160699 RepID=A0A4D7E6P4_9HYPH|nr:VOC family protein [Agrobacterium larrymoorei]QCJ01121.1 VOC family protein [Agrobacterium larrymoorei]QYA10134.1 VOC family protein [Agrobacterium larrymoorei]